MKVLILADLHLDEYHFPDAVEQLGAEIRAAGADAEALIIAGDLCEMPSTKWDDALLWLRSHFPDRPIHIIPGNHDYYGEEIGAAEAAMARICRRHGCHFAQTSAFHIGETRFLTATLWTDFGLFTQERGEGAIGYAMMTARKKVSDYGVGSITIGNPERQLRPKDTACIHESHLTWLKEELARAHEGPTVVVTHHAPSISVAGAPSELSPCFVSDLDWLIEQARPEAWFFGHTHRDADMRAPGGTLIRNVSIGREYEISPTRLEARVRAGILDLAGLERLQSPTEAPESLLG